MADSIYGMLAILVEQNFEAIFVSKDLTIQLQHLDIFLKSCMQTSSVAQNQMHGQVWVHRVYGYLSYGTPVRHAGRCQAGTQTSNRKLLLQFYVRIDCSTSVIRLGIPRLNKAQITARSVDIFCENLGGCRSEQNRGNNVDLYSQDRQNAGLFSVFSMGIVPLRMEKYRWDKNCLHRVIDASSLI